MMVEEPILTDLDDVSITIIILTPQQHQSVSVVRLRALSTRKICPSNQRRNKYPASRNEVDESNE